MIDGLMENRIEIGNIAGGHGLKGEIKVYPFTDNPANLLKTEYFYLNEKKMKVTSSKLSGRFVVFCFDEIKSREEADTLKNTLLYIDRVDAAPLEEDSFYIRDLIGCVVFNGANRIGELQDVLQTGANDVYSIRTDEGEEILLPAVKSVISSIDIVNKRIDAAVPEGLVENIDF